MLRTNLKPSPDLNLPALQLVIYVVGLRCLKMIYPLGRI